MTIPDFPGFPRTDQLGLKSAKGGHSGWSRGQRWPIYRQEFPLGPGFGLPRAFFWRFCHFSPLLSAFLDFYATFRHFCPFGPIPGFQGFPEVVPGLDSRLPGLPGDPPRPDSRLPRASGGSPRPDSRLPRASGGDPGLDSRLPRVLRRWSRARFQASRGSQRCPGPDSRLPRGLQRCPGPDSRIPRPAQTLPGSPGS